MNTFKYAVAGIALGGGLLAASAGVAGAEPLESSENISLSIGNVTILESADLVKATNVAGAVCNLDAAEVNTVAQKAATETEAQPVCTLPGGEVTFAPASSVTGELPESAPAADWPAESGHSMDGSTDPVEPAEPAEQLPG